MEMDIQRFLEEDGRIKQMPKRKEPRDQVLCYMAGKFDFGREYTEKEVNAIIDTWHSFGDYFLIRRELIDYAWMMRRTDGSLYWRNSDKIEEEK